MRSGPCNGSHPWPIQRGSWKEGDAVWGRSVAMMDENLNCPLSETMLAELGWKDINPEKPFHWVFSFQPNYYYIHSNNEHHIYTWLYKYQNRVLYYLRPTVMNRTISFIITEGRLPFCIGNSSPNTGINSIFLPLLGWFIIPFHYFFKSWHCCT